MAGGGSPVRESGVRSTKWGFLSFCQAINKSLCALLLYLSYNEVGWLPVRGLDAWPGACINSTSATSVRLSLALTLAPSHPPQGPGSAPCFLLRVFSFFSSCPPFSSDSFRLLHSAHTLLFPPLHLPASTHQRSVPMRARSRIRWKRTMWRWRWYDGPLTAAGVPCSKKNYFKFFFSTF